MSKPRSKIKVFCCCLIFVLLTTGCWGRRETDELGYILATGIDKTEENIVKITFQIAVPSALAGGGGSGGDKASEVISVEAASLFGALQLANAFVSRDLTFIHNELVVVSEDIAREGLDRYINPLLRSREIRRNITIAVSQGSAAEFLKNNEAVLEKNTARQFELLFNAKGYTGFIIDTTLNEFSKRAKSPGANPVLPLVGITKEQKKNKTEEKTDFAEMVREEVSYLPGEVPREGGNKIEIIGLAAFKSDRLVGYLNGTETRYYQMMTGDFNSAILTIPEPDLKDRIIVVKVTRGRSPERKVDISSDKPKITVKVILEGEILSIQSGINYEQGQKAEELEQYIEDLVKRGASEVIKKTQVDFKSDIFGFGEGSRRSFWTWQEWINYGWLERYAEAEVTVDISLEIRRTGLMRRTAPIPEEGTE